LKVKVTEQIRMTTKSKGMGLGITLGAALGVVLGVMAGHIALWLGLGMAIGIAIGSTMRRTTCAHCEAEKQNQQSGATNSKLIART
jgi:uncharacterized membrane protein YoaK (UPF0700 family)